MKHHWTCQRVSQGVKCGTVNRAVERKCQLCGKPKPARKRPAHTAALDLPYETYVEINGGEWCGICGVGPSPNRRLDRDHEHRADGKARGLLCWDCNKRLSTRIANPEWLRAAVAYLERTA